MKKLQLVLIVLLLTSCGQIQRIMDGTETLPRKMDSMAESTAYVKEGVRKQKQSEALKMMKEEINRRNLFPIPFDMMAPAKTLAESLTPDEAVLFVKNYLIKINKQPSVTSVPEISEAEFNHGRSADYSMLVLVSGFLPDKTLEGIVKKESDQGAYQDIMFAILKMRVDFNSGMMLLTGVLGLDFVNKDAAGEYVVLDPSAKLDTLGKIEKAIEYNNKVDYICNLDFVDKIGLVLASELEFQVTTFDKEQAKKNWQLILKRAESDYAVQSLMKNPKENEQQTKEYAERYDKLLAELKQKAQ